MKTKFTFIDLFAGIGGMRIPFDKHGECVFTSEMNAAARLVYCSNFRVEDSEIDRDVSAYSERVPSSFPNHDLLLAGFPCQPFSHAGHKRGFEDTRGTLFFSIAKIAQSKKPKVLLLENVRGLVNHDSGHTFRRILETLNQIGYDVHHKILNARDFGLPQNRNRIFIVAIRKDLQNSKDYRFPLPTHDRSKLRLGDFLDRRVPESFTISDRLWQGHQLRKAKNTAAGKGFGYQLFTRHSQYAATISARYFKDGSEVLINQKNKNPRKLTPREGLRLQGFPEEYIHHPSNTQAFKQIGNAVPVKVVEAIAESLYQYLN